MSRNGTVYSAKCQCKAGLGQACSHIAALLFKLEDLKRQGLAVIPEDVTCTGTLQQWHVPPKRDVQAAAVKDITFPKAQYGKTPKVIKKRLGDSKPTSKGAGDTIAVETLLTKASQACLKSGLSVHFEMIQFIEKSTREQSAGQLWLALHNGRLTSSLFCEILHRRDTTNLVSRIMRYNCLQYPTAAMKLGTEHERTAQAAYIHHMRQGGCEVTITNSDTALIHSLWHSGSWGKRWKVTVVALEWWLAQFKAQQVVGMAHWSLWRREQSRRTTRASCEQPLVRSEAQSFRRLRNVLHSQPNP